MLQQQQHTQNPQAHSSNLLRACVYAAFATPSIRDINMQLFKCVAFTCVLRTCNIRREFKYGIFQQCLWVLKRNHKISIRYLRLPSKRRSWAAAYAQFARVCMCLCKCVCVSVICFYFNLNIFPAMATLAKFIDLICCKTQLA